MLTYAFILTFLVGFALGIITIVSICVHFISKEKEITAAYDREKSRQILEEYQASRPGRTPFHQN